MPRKLAGTESIVKMKIGYRLYSVSVHRYWEHVQDVKRRRVITVSAKHYLALTKSYFGIKIIVGSRYAGRNVN